jgi:putative tryptophan/tyrosine transport system substrate-binding protein
MTFMRVEARQPDTRDLADHSMLRRDFLGLLGGMAAWPLAASAQETMPVIGFLSSGSPGPFTPFVAGFRRGLAEQGYTEDRNVRIDYRWAEGNYGKLDTFAAELIQSGVALIAATGGVVSAKAAMRATTNIPIIFVVGFDPVELGLVESHSRPGHNVTGVSVHTTELAEKRLELLERLVPGIRTVGVLANPGSITTKLEIENMRGPAQKSGRSLVSLLASTESEIVSAFESAVQQKVDAIIVTADPFFNVRRDQIVALAARHRIPASYPSRLFVAAGGLMSYGTEISWAYQRVGVYAGRILKGTKPHELPVELPTSFNLTINLGAAKGLGLNVSAEMQAIASEVIDGS